MRNLSKAARKLGLGGAAIKLSEAFTHEDICAMDTDSAREILSAVYPDQGGSCLREQPLRPVKPGTAVDIIMPAYNVEDYVRACMESALSQGTKYPLHIIAVDDGSADATGQILDEYAAADGRVEVLHEKNSGPGRARNAALARSEAKYIYFIDADDVLAPGIIERLADCAEENGADVVEGAYKIVDLNGRTLKTMPHRSGKLLPTRDCFGFSCGKLFRREVFADIQFPEGLWYEDSVNAHVILPRLEQRGGRAYGVEDCVFSYRVNPKGITQGGKKSAKCLDALWTHLRLYEDRRRLGMENTQSYYEYMLDMLVMSYRRTENQGEEVKRAMFAVWAEFMEKEFGAFQTQRALYKNLEDAVRRRDYGRYSLFCRLA